MARVKHQAKRHVLSKFANRSKLSDRTCTRYEFLLFVLLLLVVIIVTVNLQLVSVTSTVPSPSTTLPKFVSSIGPYPSKPKGSSDLSTNGDIKDPVAVAWGQWAATPLTGSYCYDSGTGPCMIIHMPPPMSTNNRQIRQQSQKQSDQNGDFALATLQGQKSETGSVPNQDRVAIISWPKTTPSSSSTDTECWWMGLFDGHGELGHAISQFALYSFVQQLAQATTRPNDNKLVKFIHQIYSNTQDTLPHLTGSGSTGISIWKHGTKLHISNVGDSTAFVASIVPSLKVDILAHTLPHKPNLPAERRRIEAVGGEVQEGEVPGSSSRVLYPVGPYVMGLAMSRSLGDEEGTHYGVIAEPTTFILDLNDELKKKQEEDAPLYFVVVASDGLMDELSQEHVAQRLGTALIRHTSSWEATEELVTEASHGWANRSADFGMSYRDDISIAVHRLRL